MNKLAKYTYVKIRYGMVIIISLLGACRPMALQFVSPSGPPEYVLGWEDGCDSGLSAQGGWEYKLMYGFKKRPEMGVNEQYKGGWNEGFTYCRFTLAGSGKASWSDIGMGSGF